MRRFLVVLSALACVLEFTPARAEGPRAPVTGPSVSPQGGSTTAPWGSSGNSVVFQISNASGTAETYELACSRTGVVSGCSITFGGSVLVPAYTTVDRTVVFSMSSSPASGTVRLTATLYGDPGEVEPCWEEPCPPPPPPPMWQSTGYYNVTVPPPPPPMLAWGWSPERADYGVCAFACFTATHAQGTVPYVSLDIARNVTLVYNEDRTSLKPFVLVDVMNAPVVPDEIKLQVKVNGTFVTFRNGEQLLRFGSGPASQYRRIGGQFDAAAHGLGTGLHTLEAIVTSVYNGSYGGYQSGSVISTAVSYLAILDERNSPVARGWTIGGLQRLYSQSDERILIAEGDGSYTSFLKSGSAYVARPGDFTRLEVFAAADKYVRTYPDSSKAIFDATGRLTKSRDRFGVETAFVYDGYGRLWYIQENGGWTELLYDGNGLNTIEDPFGRITAIVVNASRLLTAIQDPDGVSTAFGYDGSQRLQTITDRRGKTTTLGYDADFGKLAFIQAPQVFVFDRGNQYPTTRFAPWQKQGVPTGSTSGTPFPSVRADSVYAEVMAPDSIRLRFRLFTAHGQPTFTQRPYGLVDTVYYNASGQPVDVRPAGGARATYTYDGAGFMTQSDVDGITVNRLNGGWGLARRVWGDVTAQDVYLNPANGRVDSLRVADNNAMKYRYTYDGYGRVITATDPMGDLLGRSWYNGTNGNRSKDSLPGGRVTTHGYDGYGRWTNVTQAGQPTRTTEFDVLNRPTRFYDGVYATPTVLAYDSLYLKSVTDAKGQVYQYVRDALGRVTGNVDPAGRQDLAEYGWMGEIRRFVNRRGEAVTFAYDSLLRRTVRSGTNFATDQLSYTPDGRVVTGTSATSTEIVYLSRRGQEDSVKTTFQSDPSKIFWRRYSYDARGRLTSVLNDGSTQWFQNRLYSWSDQGTLESITLGSTVTTFGYNADRRREFTALPGGIDTISQQHTQLHSLGKLWSSGITEKYHYDLPGRLDRAWHGAPTNQQERYRYDGLGRLDSTYFDTGAGYCYTWVGWDGYICTNFGPADSTHSFDYDSVGNRVDHGGGYGVGNRIQVFDGCSYGSDYDGNVTSRACPGETVTFAWNALNQLTSYTRNGATVEVRYDAFGRLVRQWGNGVNDQPILWDRGHVYAILSGDLTYSHVQYSYYPGTDRLHTTWVGNHHYMAHQDGLGNVKALTESTTLKRTYLYDEWGQLKGGTDPGNLANRDRARFKGALWMGDAGAELYYMRNRWYEPRTGRFLSEDPLGMMAGLNFYAYAGADPVNFGDPTGLHSCGRAGGDHIHEITSSHTDRVTGDRVIDSVTTIIDGGCGDWEELTDLAARRGAALAATLGIPVRYYAPQGSGMVNLLTGFADGLSLGLGPLARALARGLGCGSCDNPNYSSGAYVGGMAAGSVVSMTMGSWLALGGDGVLGIHGANHTFPIIGRWSHIQLTIWERGLTNSHIRFRLPLPWK